MEISENQTYTGFFSQNVELLEDKLALRLSYFHFESAGAGDAPNLPNFDYSFYDRDRVEAAFLWHPKKDQENEVILRLVHDESGGNPRANTTIIPGAVTAFDRRSLANTPPRYPAKRLSAGLETSFVLGEGLRLETMTSFQDVDVLESFDLDGGPVLGWTVAADYDQREFSQSIGLSGGEDWRWKSGAYFGTSRHNLIYSGVGLATAAGVPFRSDSRTDVETFALYGELARELGKEVTVTAGLRYQYDDRDFVGTSKIGEGPRNDTFKRQSDQAFLPSLRLVWDQSDTRTFGLKIARGYRAGGVSHAGIVGSSAIYDAERSWDVELSFEEEIREDLTLGAVFFASWLDDHCLLYTSPSPRD